MANTIQTRRGAELDLPTLNSGEFGFSTDSYRLWIGDGATNHEIGLDGIAIESVDATNISSVLFTRYDGTTIRESFSHVHTEYALVTQLAEYAPVEHNLLSITHSDTTAANVVRGDIIVGIGATPKWERLAIGTTGKVLTSDGTDISWETPTVGVVTSIDGGTYITITGTAAVPIVNHDNTSRSDTASAASPAYGATFTAIDSVTTNATGHITALNVKTVTLPSTDDTWRPVTAGGNTLGDAETLAFTAGTNVSITEAGGAVTINSTDQYVGTVTSVSAGDGMDFTTITSTGAVTMGTPSTLTAATTNAVTTTSHTHEITGFEPTITGTIYKLAAYTATDTLTELAAVGATGEYLVGNTGAIPSWSTIPINTGLASVNATNISSVVFTLEDATTLIESFAHVHTEYSLTTHLHDDRYYTETESDAKYLLNTTDTLTGTLTVTAGIIAATGKFTTGAGAGKVFVDAAGDGLGVWTTGLLTDTNYYATSYAWTPGTTEGPTGTLTMSGASNVAYAAIPSASITASGIVTTETQSFVGAKTFTSGIISTTARFTTGASDGYIAVSDGSGNLTWTSPSAYTYTLPLAADGTRGGIQIGYTPLGANLALQLTSEKAFIALTKSAIETVLTGTITSHTHSGLITINNNVNNRIITATGSASTLEAESSFTYDGVGLLQLANSPTPGSPTEFIIKDTVNAAVGPHMVLSHTRTTGAYLSTSDEVGEYQFWASDIEYVGGINMYASETHTAANHGSVMHFNISLQSTGGFFKGMVLEDNYLNITRGLLVNDSGLDFDSRIESLNNPYMFFIDASADNIGINNSDPLSTFDITGSMGWNKADALGDNIMAPLSSNTAMPTIGSTSSRIYMIAPTANINLTYGSANIILDGASPSGSVAIISGNLYFAYNNGTNWYVYSIRKA